MSSREFNFRQTNFVFMDDSEDEDIFDDSDICQPVPKLIVNKSRKEELNAYLEMMKKNERKFLTELGYNEEKIEVSLKLLIKRETQAFNNTTSHCIFDK